jgi:hypothetical protein
MSAPLKKSLINKMDVNSSPDFDVRFFEKLDEQKKRPSSFANWLTWAVSGCATASVLFIAVTSYNFPDRHSFNHKEYVDSVLEIQKTVNEDISRDADLTSHHHDEI